MKLDFLIGENKYSTTRVFSHQFAAALRRLGVEVRCFEISEGGFGAACGEIFNDPPDLTCSFSDLTVGKKKPLGDQWQIPHLSLLVDPLIYYLHQLKGVYSLVTCVDEEDWLWARRGGFSKVLFLPHGVDAELSGNEENKDFDVVMFATCHDSEKILQEWKERFSSSVQKLLQDAAEKVLSPEGGSTFQALVQANVAEKDLICFHHELDRYVCAKDRISLAKACASFELSIWGEGPWKKYVPEAKCYPAVDFENAIELMKCSKIVLNSCPRFKKGSHERLFHGLACGAAVVTGETSFSRAHFSEEEGVIFYPFGCWEQIQVQVEHLLKDEEQRLRRVKKGATLTRQKHSWDNRAQALIDFLKNHFKISV